ncbi:hypothetical protein ACFOEE_08820 [Pseudoalteromonas fenneropenaei]|uniref:Uncharacterized protein n=1 Tax=Pseudoalteromonas fenneropenaei TaxID=1737459 RepID=A0ABV7CIZ8_9GAMM
MAIITYTSLSNIKNFSINELPNTPQQIEQQLHNYNEMAHAYSPAPFDLIRLSMTQPLTSQYCAAYSLTAVAATFGILPEDKTIAVTRGEGCPSKVTLSCDDNFSTLALKLFTLTRFDVEEIKKLFDLKCESERSEKVARVLEEAKKGGSMPRRVAEVAESLGLQATLFVTSDAYDNFATLAQKMIKELGSTASPQEVLAFVFGDPQKFTVTNSPMPIPQADELNLVLVSTPVNSLHWVALSSDSTYFDSLRNYQPGGQFGCVGSSWSSRPYVDTGVWVTVKRKTQQSLAPVKLNSEGLFTFD